MKNLKNPTRNQKEMIRKKNLDFKNYLVKEENKEQLILVDKATGEIKLILKQAK